MICKIRCLEKQFSVNGRRRVLEDACALLPSAGRAGRGPAPATARDAGGSGGCARRCGEGAPPDASAQTHAGPRGEGRALGTRGPAKRGISTRPRRPSMAPALLCRLILEYRACHSPGHADIFHSLHDAMLSLNPKPRSACAGNMSIAFPCDLSKPSPPGSDGLSWPASPPGRTCLTCSPTGRCFLERGLYPTALRLILDSSVRPSCQTIHAAGSGFMCTSLATIYLAP